MALGSVIYAILPPLLALLLAKAIGQSKSRSFKVGLPPGPKKHLVTGNLLDVTGNVKEDCKRYKKWSKDFDSDIIYLNVLGSSFLALNTFEATTEFLENRSSINSGRSRMPMIKELMGWDFNLTFKDYGESWRIQRKIMYKQFNPTAVKEFRPHARTAAHRLVRRLLYSSNDTMTEFLHLAGEVILSVTYGIDVSSFDDPFIRLAEAGTQPLLQASVPGAFLVNSLPLLKYIPAWLPGADFKQKAKKWRKAALSMIDVPFETAKASVNNGTAKASFVSKSLDALANLEDKRVSEYDVKSISGTMYQAGSDTTAVALYCCILALLEYPEVLRKAQREIDSVMLPGSIPEFDDEGTLPYVTAVIKEALRWKAMVPIAVPHCSTVEQTYNAYRIPAGTTLIPNSWAILHDEKVFPEPKSFIPERHLKNDAIIETRLQVIWGYGRRMCPGRYMAFSTVLIALSSMLAVYDISNPVDENGNVIQPNHDFSSSLLPVPIRPLKAVFTPRDTNAEDLIKGGDRFNQESGS